MAPSFLVSMVVAARGVARVAFAQEESQAEFAKKLANPASNLSGASGWGFRATVTFLFPN